MYTVQSGEIRVLASRFLHHSHAQNPSAAEENDEFEPTKCRHYYYVSLNPAGAAKPQQCL